MDIKIVIIGAGAAGIAAGTNLVERGFRNVIILEAENRIGGRIHSFKLGDGIVDLGAQWCHGEVGNVAFELAGKANLEPESFQYTNFQFIQSDGCKVPKRFTDQLCTLMYEIMGNYKKEMAEFDGSLGEFVIEKYNKLVRQAEFYNIEPDIKRQFLDFFHKFENSYEASDTWFDTSSKTLSQYWECEGNHLLSWKGKGFKSVLDIMMEKTSKTDKQLNFEKRIFLNKDVQKILWCDGSHLIKLHCSDGSIYEANHLISTVSLGVLKDQHTTLFDPPLPNEKLKPIFGLNIGTVDKIYLYYPKRWWDKNWHGFSLLWRKEELDFVRKMENNWLEDVFGFYTVDHNPTVLCAWVSGLSARRMEKLNNETLKEEILTLLRLFLKEEAYAQPTTVIASNWYSNPHFRGSYSYRSMETDKLKTCSLELAQPITNSCGRPIIQFAGEATSEHYYSTVHGAIESGWREASRLANAYKQQIDDMKIKNPNGRSVKDGGRSSVEKTVNVLILGAGLAGLGAATKCQKSGLTFLILEAQGKAGGRVNTMEMLNYHKSKYQQNEVNQKDANVNHTEKNAIFNSDKANAVIDCGAQWLHGKYNYLHEVAERHRLLIDEQSDEGLGAYLRDDGWQMDDYFVKKIDFKIGQILEECEQYARNNASNYPKSVNSFLQEKFSVFLNSFTDPQHRILAKQLFDWHIRFQIIDNSCLTLDHVSAKSWGKYSYNGESCQAHYNFRNGFSSAVDALVDELNVKNFLFKKEIIEICCNETEPIISVKCSDNTIYEADHVLVTFSLGILKAGLYKNIFKPVLPKRTVQTIRDIGFETINKLFLQFNEPWWGDLDGIQLIYRDNNYENAHWTRYISGFDVMRPGAPNTLLAWVGGKGAIEMEKLTDIQIIEDCIELLSTFTNRTVPDPIKYYCTRWHTNRFIRGAYSYISTDCDINGTSSQQLAEPITLEKWRPNKTPAFAQNQIKIEDLNLIDKLENCANGKYSNATDNVQVTGRISNRPILLFAGEACHEQYFSTAHGAFLSGIEQMEKFLEFYKNQLLF